MPGSKKVKFSDIIQSTDEELDIASVNESIPKIQKSIKKSKKEKKKKSKKSKKEKKDKSKKSKKNKKSSKDDTIDLDDISLAKSKVKVIKDKKYKSSKSSKSESKSRIKPSRMGNLSRKVVISDSDPDNESDSDDMVLETNNKSKSGKRSKNTPADISESQEIVLDDTRRWEDDKERKKTLKRGAFEKDETQLLMRALCQYCKENNLEEKDLLALVSQKNDQHKGAWSAISSVLPNRSVQSCHNHCRRKFNPYNYKGAWEEEDVELLLNYVKKYGREWEKIGQMIGRTGLNVRDKYKEIGGSNNTFRKKTKWTVEETIKLIKLVEKYSKVSILRQNIDELDYSTFDGTYRPKRISKTNVKFQPDAIMLLLSPYINYATAQTINYKHLPWTKIAEKMKTRSKDDCRNRFYLQVYNTIFQKSYFDEKLEVKLLNFIESTGAEYEIDIKFGDFWNWLQNQKEAKRFQEISAKDARIHWSKMKRIVMGRSGTNSDLDKLVRKLRQYYREVDSGKRQKNKAETNPLSGNKLVDMWRTDYKELFENN